MKIFELMFAAVPDPAAPSNSGLNIGQLITAFGIGTILTAIINWLKDRKKTDVDTSKTEIDTKLAYLNTVIQQLATENKRVIDDRDKNRDDLLKEQERSARLYARVRELEDEIDGVRRSARETQQKCDELATRLVELVADVAREDMKE